MPFPGNIDSFAGTAATGTSPLNSPDHAADHRSLGSALIAVEQLLGTTSASNGLLSNFTAGDQFLVIDSGGTLSGIITRGTAGHMILGTPSINGGTLANVFFNGGTANFAGGTINNLVTDTPALTGGTFAGTIVNNASLTGGTYTNPTITGIAYPLVKDKTTTAGSISNSTAPTTLYSYAIAANLLGTTGWMDTDLWGKAFNNTGGNAMLTIALLYSSGTTVGTLASTTRNLVTGTGTIDWNARFYLTNMGTTNAQRGGFLFAGQETVNGGNYTISGDGTVGVDSASLGTLGVRFQLGTASTSAWIMVNAAKTRLE